MRRRKHIEMAVVAAVIMAVLAISSADARRRAPASKYLPRITLNVSNGAMTSSHKNITRGDYIVVVRNYGSSPKAVRLTGVDTGGSQFVRYSRYLKPGKADKFRWYFPKGSNVVVKDVVSCTFNRRHRIHSAVTGNQQCELLAH